MRKRIALEKCVELDIRMRSWKAVDAFYDYVWVDHRRIKRAKRRLRSFQGWLKRRNNVQTLR